VVDRGGTEIDHLGEYLELERPTRLPFTWTTRDALPANSRVAVAIKVLSTGSCELTLVHELNPEWARLRGANARRMGQDDRRACSRTRRDQRELVSVAHVRDARSIKSHLLP